MGYKIKPGGYVDRQALNRAWRANRVARQALGHILDENPGRQRLLHLYATIAQALSENLDALNEMTTIRQKWKNEEREEK